MNENGKERKTAKNGNWIFFFRKREKAKSERLCLKESTSTALLNVLLSLLVLLVAKGSSNILNSHIQQSISDALLSHPSAHVTTLVICPMLMREQLNTLHTLRDIDCHLACHLGQVAQVALGSEERRINCGRLSGAGSSMSQGSNGVHVNKSRGGGWQTVSGRGLALDEAVQLVVLLVELESILRGWRSTEQQFTLQHKKKKTYRLITL